MKHKDIKNSVVFCKLSFAFMEIEILHISMHPSLFLFILKKIYIHIALFKSMCFLFNTNITIESQKNYKI